jgi:predicted cytidylate kinase
MPRSVVINGDLGSGKSTVARLLADRLQVRHVSVGDLYRAMAAERGLTALQLNLHAELDESIDHLVDELQSDLAASGERIVMDSRLAWHFFTTALKVHLITEPTVAAQRVLSRPADTVEAYPSLVEARRRLAERSDSERMRFLTRYGVDKTRLENYDLVCDTTRAAPAEIVDRVVDALEHPAAARPVCWLDPHRITPAATATDGGPLRVDTAFVAASGLAHLRTAAPLVRAELSTVDSPL